MLWLAVLSWALATPLERVAALFPSAAVVQVDGEAAVAPIHRGGEVGFIRASGISAVRVAGGRELIAFTLDTVAGVEPDPDALTEAVTAGLPEQPPWTRVFQVVLLDGEGRFLSKPEGYPLERRIQLACFGDFCDFGPRGTLVAVQHSDRFAVARMAPQPESLGSVVPFRVEDDLVRAYPPVPSGGGAGGLSGCERVQEVSGFVESKGALEAVRMRHCRISDPEVCAVECGPYPAEPTHSPVTLVEASN